MDKFIEGEIVMYIAKDHNGNIYNVELGKIKKSLKNGAFVYFNMGNTAHKTSYDDLYKISNVGIIKEDYFNSLNELSTVIIDKEKYLDFNVDNID